MVTIQMKPLMQFRPFLYFLFSMTLSLWMKSFGLTVEIKLCGRFPIGLSYFR